MTAPAPSRPVARPRDAASLLIYRGQGAQLEVLMGRRRKGARFLPNQYVFPGGGVEPHDFEQARHVAPIALLAPVPTAQALGAGTRVTAVQALCRAAAREAEEETGLRLRAGAGLHYLGRAITPTLSPVRFHARFYSAPLASFEGTLGGDGELLDLRWVNARDVASVPMIDVTAQMLETLLQRQQGTAPGWLRVSYTGEALRRSYTPFLPPHRPDPTERHD